MVIFKLKVKFLYALKYIQSIIRMLMRHWLKPNFLFVNLNQNWTCKQSDSIRVKLFTYYNCFTFYIDSIALVFFLLFMATLIFLYCFYENILEF